MPKPWFWRPEAAATFTKAPGFVLIAALAAASPAWAGDLVIDVTDIRNDRGDIRFALHNDPEQFPEGERFKGFEDPAKPGTITVTVEDLPPGRYAVALHHDENRDDEMNTNFFGWPLEGFGFSKDARVLLSAPTFEAAAFDVPAKGTRISIRVRY